MVAQLKSPTSVVAQSTDKVDSLYVVQPPTWGTWPNPSYLMYDDRNGADADTLASKQYDTVQSDKGGTPFGDPTPIHCGMAIDAAELQAGVHYPADLSEFDLFFPDEEACVRYLPGLRWPDGFVCPKCQQPGEGWRMSGGLLRCRSCRGRTSVTAGTIFEGTRKPLKLWFNTA